ncbi:uncharacterized protein [Erythrolamprus reginae]|uniref:uncharacterized protein isoform X2 n=1 Tax=Erythrolamprus reginae TaxID=121349 RepID=UPI00396C9472
MAPVEALYNILQEEIQAFEKHIRSCQQAFDIHTLYNVLLLLLQEGDGVVVEIHSLEQLEKLVESKECNREDVVRITVSEDKSDIASYISWFVSYVSYLGSLKEEFDAKVVFPLCENLYVNDDSLDGLPLRFMKGLRPHPTVSIAHTARQLFALRRKWALLMKKDSICEQTFHPQSRLDLQGFTYIHPFVKILRLVPDLFHKSLAAAELTKQWVKYHASRHSSHSEHSHPVLIRRCDDIRLMKGSLTHPWHETSLSQSGLPLNHHDCRKTSPPFNNKNNMDVYKATIIQERHQLQETYGELLSLLWREERSWILEGEIQELQERCQKLMSFLQAEEEIQHDLPPADRIDSHASCNPNILSSCP